MRLHFTLITHRLQALLLRTNMTSQHCNSAWEFGLSQSLRSFGNSEFRICVGTICAVDMNGVGKCRAGLQHRNNPNPKPNHSAGK